MFYYIHGYDEKNNTYLISNYKKGETFNPKKGHFTPIKISEHQILGTYCDLYKDFVLDYCFKM